MHSTQLYSGILITSIIITALCCISLCLSIWALLPVLITVNRKITHVNAHRACQHPWHSTHRQTDRPNGLTKKSRSISESSLTTDRLTGAIGFHSPNSLITTESTARPAKAHSWSSMAATLESFPTLYDPLTSPTPLLQNSQKTCPKFTRKLEMH